MSPKTDQSYTNLEISISGKRNNRTVQAAPTTGDPDVQFSSSVCGIQPGTVILLPSQ